VHARATLRVQVAIEDKTLLISSRLSGGLLSGFALESALGASVGWRWDASGSAAQAQIIFVRSGRRAIPRKGNGKFSVCLDVSYPHNNQADKIR
jgi:hypothetical protein